MSELMANGKRAPKDPVHGLQGGAVSRGPQNGDGDRVGPGHPVYILLCEHEAVKEAIESLSALLMEVESAGAASLNNDQAARAAQTVGLLREYEKHKVREENSLFPVLERHGVMGPPAVMWTEHDQQRAAIKKAMAALDGGTAGLVSILSEIALMVPAHFAKEEGILFPMALELFSDDEWKQVKSSMDELGYCDFTPANAIGGTAEAAPVAAAAGGEVAFDTGTLSPAELEAMLNALPVDITFVDAQDRVKYFSQPKERLFPRARAVIGRSVQQCHPQKSISLINRIIDGFKSGAMDHAEFWVDARGRKIHIRYFAVRGKDGAYLGCVGVDQDVTEIQKLQGEKRLL